MKKLTVRLQSVLEKWEYSNKIISGGVVTFLLDGVLYRTTLQCEVGGWFIGDTIKDGGIIRSSKFSPEKERYIANQLVKELGWKENNDLLSLSFKIEELKGKGAVKSENENPWFTTIEFYVNDVGLKLIESNQVVQGRLERDADYQYAVSVPIVYAEYILGGTLITVYESEKVEVEEVLQKVDFTTNTNTEYMTVSEAIYALQDLMERGFGDKIVFISDDLALTDITCEHNTVFCWSAEYDEPEEERYLVVEMNPTNFNINYIQSKINLTIPHGKDLVMKIGSYQFATYECKRYGFGKNMPDGDFMPIGGLKEISSNASMAVDAINTLSALRK